MRQSPTNSDAKPDKLFSTYRNQVERFSFNHDVVAVFDDMIKRSVPQYEEILYRQAQLIEKVLNTGEIIYDLGCSTGNLGMAFCALESTIVKKQPFTWCGYDTSAPMLEKFSKRLASHPAKACFDLSNKPIQHCNFSNAKVVVLNFTLQFIPHEDRQALITKIYDALPTGGILLLSEKFSHSSTPMHELQQAFYFQFKRENGYSDMEISQKRDALEKVLVPDTQEAHFTRLKQAGFKHMDMWLKWFNFASFICQK